MDESLESKIEAVFTKLKAKLHELFAAHSTKPEHIEQVVTAAHVEAATVAADAVAAAPTTTSGKQDASVAGTAAPVEQDETLNGASEPQKSDNA